MRPTCSRFRAPGVLGARNVCVVATYAECSSGSSSVSSSITRREKGVHRAEKLKMQELKLLLLPVLAVVLHNFVSDVDASALCGGSCCGGMWWDSGGGT